MRGPVFELNHWVAIALVRPMERPEPRTPPLNQIDWLFQNLGQARKPCLERDRGEVLKSPLSPATRTGTADRLDAPRGALLRWESELNSAYGCSGKPG